MTSADVGPAQAAAHDDAVLLDVREPHEWRAGHVEGAVHVPMGQLTLDAAVLATDRTIICVCRSGNRSGQVARALAEHGHDAVNLLGGMQAWAAAGLPMVAEGDVAPRVA